MKQRTPNARLIIATESCMLRFYRMCNHHMVKKSLPHSRSLCATGELNEARGGGVTGGLVDTGVTGSAGGLTEEAGLGSDAAAGGLGVTSGAALGVAGELIAAGIGSATVGAMIGAGLVSTLAGGLGVSVGGLIEAGLVSTIAGGLGGITAGALIGAVAAEAAETSSPLAEPASSSPAATSIHVHCMLYKDM